MSSDELFWKTYQFLLDELLSNTDEKFYAEIKHLADETEYESSSFPKQTHKYINRNREDGDNRLWRDYFSEQLVFGRTYFIQRFQMSQKLFLRIVEGISNDSDYFKQKIDCVGRKSFSSIQKCTTVIRQLAYGTTADQFDEYIRIGESTSIKCLQNFCRCVNELYSNEYLRRPNVNDIQRLLQKHSEVHGFAGMLGSIDYMQWAWKNCPVAWKGQFTRDDQGCPTIMLEVVASYDLWIWHAYFGVAGSNNDINVLNQSPLFNDILQGCAPSCEFTVNGTTYTKGYYLADGIYPEWSTLVKSFSHPQYQKRKKYKKMHEAARKYVERAFGVLQSRWGIIRGPARSWSKETLKDIMYACIILHNMIVKDEGNAISNWSDDSDTPIQVSHGSITEFQQLLRMHTKIRVGETHHNLRADLVEDIWHHFGHVNNQY